MPESSNAQQLFNRFKSSSAPFQLLTDLVRDQQPENEWLDYKQCPATTGGTPNFEKIKSMWSEAVCGYANTGGGLLIWGVEAPKELPTDMKPVFMFEELKAYLEKNIQNATIPSVYGIECLGIVDPDKADHGYVICYIPAGKHRPYRAEQQGKRFIQRVSHSFDDIQPSLLRYMFYPQTRTDYEIVCRCQTSTQDKPNISYYFLTSIRNAGTRTAGKLVLEVDSNYRFLDTGVSTRLTTDKSVSDSDVQPSFIRFRFQDDLHPSMRANLPFIILTRTYPGDGVPMFPTPFLLRFYFHANDAERRDYVLHFDQAAMNAGKEVYAMVSEMDGRSGD